MRTVSCICIQLLLWSIFSRSGQAQHDSTSVATTFRVDRIGVSDGLAQGSVYYILKDSREFLWFGTQDGLNRYDGHRFRTYRPIVDEQGTIRPGTIRGTNILGIVEDPDSNLWIGTEEGLNRYNRRNDRFDFISVRNHVRGASRTIPFFADKSELLYLSDTEGLVRFDYRNRHKTVLNARLRPRRKYDLQSSTANTPAGNVWLHASTGLIRYNLHDQTLTYYFSDHPQNQFGPPSSVLSFYIDADDIVWLGTTAGLIRFDYRHHNYQTYTTVGTNSISSIFSITPDQRGQLWLGTQNDGVLYFDKKSSTIGQINTFTNHIQRLSDFKISKVYVDRQGIIWANTDPDGLARIVPDVFLFRGFVKRQFTDTLAPYRKLSNYVIRGFLEEQPDRLWILTEGGINILNPRTNRIVERFPTYLTATNSSTLSLSKSLYRDPKGRIWVGTTKGIMAFQAPSKTFDLIPFPVSEHPAPDNYVRNLVSVSDAVLIAATEDGLYSFDTNKRSLTRLPELAGQNIFSLWFDPKNRHLWVGTYLNGYYCYQLAQSGKPGSRTTSWKLIRSGLQGYTVLHIRPDSNGQTMWLSCDRGLVSLNAQTNRFTLYTEQQGLANSFVYGTLTDSQNKIWMSTNRGLSRLDLLTKQIKNFTPNDGLQGYEYNGNAFLRASTGEFYVGGVNGFNRFQPDAFHNSRFDPSVYIYSLNVNEEPYKSDKYVGEASQIELNHTQNTLALEFAALDYSSNGHNTYQYQLINYDKHWIAAGERNYVRYTNLPPGHYIFQVKAANQDGRWSPHIKQLLIHIEPPFWLTLPFVFILILVLLGTIWWWVRQRENSIREHQAERLRLAYDIQEQVKKDIARDIHDEIGTRLATIKLYTTQLTKQAGETPAILSLKNTVFQLINDTISDVRNMLRKLNPQTLERHGYVAAVEELFSRITASGVISAQFLLSEIPVVEDAAPTNENRLPADTEVMLYRITQELVSNSLKHANASRIDLHIIWQPERLVLIYQDNGQGFNYEQLQKKATGLGMSNIESRVAILGGRISWESQPGQGVQATIDVPINPVRKRRFFEPQTRFPLSN
ncbi:two-component regulator propeller domain-containing protein [Spirosoma sp. KNUC1025]|uniref:ligand-binding sensor domain-containing protein n=1 Tax=Spirosoma sp. KNUC1025 TaxID=2894082 RepID=UPI00386A162C|nr:histidine kinase [Spirosoma sp. KNUC1025]